MPEDEYISEERKQYEDLKIRRKIIDMRKYALPLIKKWSVAEQKLLGNDIAALMFEMQTVACDLDQSYSPKTPLKKLDYLNLALKDNVTLAYELKYLKGDKSRNEWMRRSGEIGKMIGGLTKAVYGEEKLESTHNKKRHVHSKRPR